MKLESLSASSAKLFESCPAAWKTRYARSDGKRPAELAGDAATLGTAIHTTLEKWVDDGYYLKHVGQDAADQITNLYQDSYWHHFSHGERFTDGLNMVLNWVQRQSWENREVISTEVKRSFDLKTPVGLIPVFYVFDRLDRKGDDLEVVDYKSGVRNVYADTLRDDIQARTYALAAQIEYPDVERIWVTFDMLRYSDVGVSFTKADNRRTLRYYEQLARRILASDGTDETLNIGCRWCVRKHVCGAIQAHLDEKGPLSFDDIDDIASRRDRYDTAVRTLELMRDELDTAILDYAEAQDMDEFSAGGVSVRVTSKRSRALDSHLFADAVGDDMEDFIRRYGNPGVRSVERALKDRWGSIDQRLALEGALVASHSGSRVTTTA